MSDHPLENNVLRFRKSHQRKKTPSDSVEIIELPLPEPDRISATDLLAAVSRSPAPEFEKAVVFLTRTVKCPCGCGEDVEEMEVFYGGGEITNERLNWIAEKIKQYSTG